MKTYTKLPLPKDSAWDNTRFKWGLYFHWRIRYFFNGVYNIFRWIPTIYRDKDFDDYFITKIIQKKIEHQRKHLVECNRHTGVHYDNYWMTVLLNLLEREHDQFYELEKYDYVKYEGSVLESKITLDETTKYLSKYKSSIRRMTKSNLELEDKESMALLVGMHNQKRCRDLIFEILKTKSANWWD